MWQSVEQDTNTQLAAGFIQPNAPASMQIRTDYPTFPEPNRDGMHAAIRELARSGVGIIVISSDVEELAILADRVVVLREGHVTGELAGDEISEARIIELSYMHTSEIAGADEGKGTGT
jgi:hypothetical protein